MMTKVKTFLQNFIKYFLYIAVFAQIVSGTVYLVCNFTAFTAYPETKEMVDAARTFILDEYIGLFYPLFVRLCLGIQNLFGIGYYLVAHLVQLVAFLGASLYLVKPFFAGKKLWIAGLLITTFPMCMQSILMVAPFAFKTAFGFFILGAMVRIWKQKDGVSIGNVLIMLAAYVFAAFNQPDDLYLWIVPMAILGIVLCFRKKTTAAVLKKICVMLAIVIVFLGVFGVSSKVYDVGARGRMHKSVYSVMFQRTMWPGFSEKYSFWPIELYAYYTKTTAMQMNSYAESLVYYVGPMVEEDHGIDKADEIYKQAVKNQFAYNKVAIFKAVSSDFVGYVLQPYTTVSYMNGQDGSAFGKLYSLLNDHEKTNPYSYFCVSFVTLFSLSFVGILNVVKNRLFAKKGVTRNFVCLAGLLGYHAIWYTIVNVQGVDYRYVLLNVGIFILLALKGSLFMYEGRNAQ